MKLGIDKMAMIRVRAGISYALTEAMDEGHCGLPTEELVPLAVALLAVPEAPVRIALEFDPTWTAGPDFAIENGGNAGG